MTQNPTKKISKKISWQRLKVEGRRLYLDIDPAKEAGWVFALSLLFTSLAAYLRPIWFFLKEDYALTIGGLLLALATVLLGILALLFHTLEVSKDHHFRSVGDKVLQAFKICIGLGLAGGPVCLIALFNQTAGWFVLWPVIASFSWSLIRCLTILYGSLKLHADEINNPPKDILPKDAKVTKLESLK